MSEDDSDKFSRETLIDERFLHTEYQEVNQEFRHRNQLVHNTFYLFIIAAGVFLGLFLRFGLDGNMDVFGGIALFSGIVGSIIGHLFLKHFHERSSAEAVRTHLERVANKQLEDAKKALSIEYAIAGGGAKLRNDGRIVRRGSHMHHLGVRPFGNRPKNIVSAETIGLALVYVGGGLVAIGSAIVGIHYTSDLLGSYYSIMGGFILYATISVLVVYYSYKWVISESAGPGDEIYE